MLSSYSSLSSFQFRARMGVSSVWTLRRTRLNGISVQECCRAVRDSNVSRLHAGQGSCTWPGLGGPFVKSAMISYTPSLPGPNRGLSFHIHTNCGEREGMACPSQHEAAAGHGSGTYHLFSFHPVSQVQATPRVLMGTDLGTPPMEQCGWMT